MLADFGISACMGDAANDDPEAAAGAPGYRAPEARATPAADVWALGATVHDLLGPSGSYKRRLVLLGR